MSFWIQIKFLVWGEQRRETTTQSEEHREHCESPGGRAGIRCLYLHSWTTLSLFTRWMQTWWSRPTDAYWNVFSLHFRESRITQTTDFHLIVTNERLLHLHNFCLCHENAVQWDPKAFSFYEWLQRQERAAFKVGAADNLMTPSISHACCVCVDFT